MNEPLLFVKAGPFIGPRGGKWADAAHTVPWKESPHPKEKQVSAKNPYLFDLDPHQLIFTETGQRTGDPSKQGHAGIDHVAEVDASKPITVTKIGNEYHVLDGHHRTIRARREKRPVRAFVIPHAAVKKMRAEGTHQGEMFPGFARMIMSGEYAGVSKAIATFSDLVKAGPHKYTSKKPDGKGGWIYEYKKEGADGGKKTSYYAGSEPLPATFEPAKTPSEAYEYAKRHFAKRVYYKGMDLDAVNQSNEALYDIFKSTGMAPLGKIECDLTAGGHALASAAGSHVTITKLTASAKKCSQLLSDGNAIYGAKAANLDQQIERISGAIDKAAEWSEQNNVPVEDNKHHTDLSALLEKRKSQLEHTADRHNVGDTVKDVVIHELGHIAHNRSPTATKPMTDEQRAISAAAFHSDEPGIFMPLNSEAKNDALKVSGYASTNRAEYFAEAWTSYHRGEQDRLTPEMTALIEASIADVKKHGDKWRAKLADYGKVTG